MGEWVIGGSVSRKPIKSRAGTLLKLLAVTFGILVLVLAALFIPALQRGLLARGLSAAGATGIELGYFHATPFGITAERVKFRRGPLGVDVRGLRIATNPWALRRRRLEITEVSAAAADTSWDLAYPAETGATGSFGPESRAAAPTRTFAGVLAMMPPARALWVGSLALQGGFTLFRGKVPVVESHWTVRGAGLRPGTTAALDCRVGAGGLAMSAGGAVVLQGTLSATEDGAGRLARLEFQGGSTASGGVFNLGSSSLGFAVTANPDGESYEFHEAFGRALGATASGKFSRSRRDLSLHADLTGDPSAEASLDSFRQVTGSSGALSGSVDARFKLDGPIWSLVSAGALLKGGSAGSQVRLELAEPWRLAGPEANRLPASVLRIEHFPINLADPRLARAGIALGPCELGGAWRITQSGDAIAITSVEPLAISGLRIGGSRLPGVRGVNLTALPRFEIRRDSARIVVDGLRLDADGGWRLGGSCDLTLGWVRQPMLRISALELAAGRGSGSPAFLSASLLRPIDLDRNGAAAALLRAGPGDLIRISAHDAPLAWLSHLTPGRSVDGTLVAGGAVVSSTVGPGIAVTTTTPWSFAGLRVLEGGRVLFNGSLEASPSLAYGPTKGWVRVDRLVASDTRGYRLTGSLGAGLRGGDGRMGGRVALEGDIPGLAGPGTRLGPLHFTLSALAHAFPDGKGDLARLAFTLASAQGRTLVSVAADQPVTIARTENAEWLIGSPLPLRVSTAALSLSRLNPWLKSGNLALGGMISPSEFRLSFSPRRVRIQSAGALGFTGFHLERLGDVLIDRAILRSGVSLDLDIEHRLLPVFRMKGAAVLRASDGMIAEGGSTVARFDGRIGLSATEKGGGVNDVAGSLWLDLGAMGRIPFLSGARLPAKGELTLTLAKSQSRTKVVEFDARIDHLVGRNGAAAPALLLVGRARADVNQRVAGFGLQATLQTVPRPSDLHFGMRFDFGQLRIVDLSSKLEGNYIDGDELKVFMAAFSPAAPRPPRPPSSAFSTPVSQPAAVGSSVAVRAGDIPRGPRRLFGRTVPVILPPGGPPWGSLRGHFTLAIKTIVMRPYVMENLGGRLDVTADCISLSGLSAGLLDGKWTADGSVRYKPGAPGGALGYESHFGLAQLDAGRAARMRFPKPAAGVDGRFDLDVALSGRADRIEDLAASASGGFALTGHDGRIRMTLPKGEEISNALLVGGMLTFSSELRALGRLIPRLSDVPISQMSASGRLAPGGGLYLDTMVLQSPQMRLIASGQVANAKSRDLMGQPLAVEARLAATGDLAVILAGMKLVDPPGPDGYRRMKQPFVIGGKLGQPDFHALYDVLARAVEGSSGTWGMIMRKVQAEAAKRRAPGT